MQFTGYLLYKTVETKGRELDEENNLTQKHRSFAEKLGFFHNGNVVLWVKSTRFYIFKLNFSIPKNFITGLFAYSWFAQSEK